MSVIVQFVYVVTAAAAVLAGYVAMQGEKSLGVF